MLKAAEVKVHLLLDALEVKIHSQLGFFDRGEPASPDWEVLDFTADSVWRDLDLSSIVPASAIAVVVRIAFSDKSITRYFQLRKKGHTNWPNVVYSVLQVADVACASDRIVAVDENRFVQYKTNRSLDATLQVTVMGWWLR